MRHLYLAYKYGISTPLSSVCALLGVSSACRSHLTCSDYALWKWKSDEMKFRALSTIALRLLFCSPLICFASKSMKQRLLMPE